MDIKMDINVQNRQLSEEISEHLSIPGKRILEIGCGNGDLLKYIAKYYAPNHIIGIDPGLESWWSTEESTGNNWEVLSGAAESLGFEDNEFDAVISISTFEHIANLEKTLSEIKRVLKPYGRFYTSFNPIWTSIIGHHFIAPEEDFWNSGHLALIPPWGHLYMSEAQMRTHLESENVSEPLKSQILNFIYHSSIINRKSKNEITNAVHKSGLVVRHYSEQVRFSRSGPPGQNELTSTVAEKITSAGFELSEIGVCGLKICLEKLAAF